MPRPRVDLDLYRAQITELYQQGQSSSNLATYLTQNHNVTVTSRTIERRLQEWSQSKQTRTEDTPLLRARIAILIFESYLNDKEVLEVLQDEGYSVSEYGLVRLRKDKGIIYRREKDDEREDVRLRKIVQEELDKGVIQGFG